MYLLIPPEQLEIDPRNVRRQYGGIVELANSIRANGLLQNLVVEPVDSPDEPKHFIVRAGNRRLLAIQLLIKEGFWREPVMCLVQEAGGLSQLVENIHRLDVSPLAIGHRYIEIIESGYSAAQLAQAIGKPPGHISYHVNIARYIHPEVQTILEKAGAIQFSKSSLSALCRMIEPTTGEPVLDAQMKYAHHLIDEPREPGERKIRIKTKPAEVLQHRLARLRNGEVPTERGMESAVRSVVSYLDGEVDCIRREKQ